MYLGGTLFRIHGTNQPSSIGQRVASGCIRMVNADAIDLYNRAALGTKVVVLPDTHRRAPVQDTVASVRQPMSAVSAPHSVPSAQVEINPRPQAGVPFFAPLPFFNSSASRIY